MKEPLAPSQVKKFLSKIMAEGSLSFAGHAYREMAEDNLTENDVTNTLRGGVARAGELVSGTYRYRVSTARMTAVVAFRSESAAVVVTAWREKK